MSMDRLPSRGASFWREGANVVFRFVVDPATVVGPRAATPADKLNHPEAYAAFERADALAATMAAQEASGSLNAESFVGPEGWVTRPLAVEQFDADMEAALEAATQAAREAFNGADPAKFDHDGDGQPGGSLPKMEPVKAPVTAKPKRPYTRRKKAK